MKNLDAFFYKRAAYHNRRYNEIIQKAYAIEKGITGEYASLPVTVYFLFTIYQVNVHMWFFARFAALYRRFG